MNIFWISGRCGYGKTAFADSIIKEFERESKKTCKLDGKNFVDFLIESIKGSFPINNIVNYFRNYDLFVLDDIDYAVINKPKTQRLVKETIEKITQNNKTKIILISQKRARKTKRLKFNSNCCEYIRLKAPSTEFKIKLIEEWLRKEKLGITEDKIKEIVNKSNDLFQLKGLLNQISFLAKHTKQYNAVKCS